MDLVTANKGKVFTVLLAVLVALGGHLGAFPWMPAWAEHTIELLAFIATIITATLIDPKAVAPPKLVWLLAVVVLGASISSCATFKPQGPDGHYTQAQLITLLTWAQDGLDVGCSDTWVPVDVCTFGRDGITTAKAVANKAVADIQAAVKQSLIDTEAQVPADSKLRPYLDWLIQRL